MCEHFLAVVSSSHVSKIREAICCVCRQVTYDRTGRNCSSCQVEPLAESLLTRIRESGFSQSNCIFAIVSLLECPHETNCQRCRGNFTSHDSISKRWPLSIRRRYLYPLQENFGTVVYFGSSSVFGGQVVGAISSIEGDEGNNSKCSTGVPTNLHPAGFSYSEANGTNGIRQVGVGAPGNPGDNPGHALMWTSTADSVVDLHPATSTARRHTTLAATPRLELAKLYRFPLSSMLSSGTGRQTQSLAFIPSPCRITPLQ